MVCPKSLSSKSMTIHTSQDSSSSRLLSLSKRRQIKVTSSSMLRCRLRMFLKCHPKWSSSRLQGLSSQSSQLKRFTQARTRCINLRRAPTMPYRSMRCDPICSLCWTPHKSQSCPRTPPHRHPPLHSAPHHSLTKLHRMLSRKRQASVGAAGSSR